MNADEKNRYFQELSRNLRHEGLTVKPETEKGLLPVELDGQHLCQITETSGVRYWKEDVADDRRSAALDRVTDVAKITAEYMRQMETAPQLTASGLTGDYDSTLLVLEVTPKRGLAEGDSPEYLYLPASERQIERTLLRVGITALHDAQVRLDFDELPEKAAEALDLEHLSGDDLPALNKMCRAIASLNEADMEKLNAVVLMAKPGDMMAVRQLAKNLDQFNFVPGVQTPEEYGKHMIQDSGHFEYDENLEGFYDYRRYGEQCIRQEGGQFNECGYVMYQGLVPLEELMRDVSSEQCQGPRMGGLSC